MSFAPLKAFMHLLGPRVIWIFLILAATVISWTLVVVISGYDAELPGVLKLQAPVRQTLPKTDNAKVLPPLQIDESPKVCGGP